MSGRLRVVLATRNAGKAREFDRLLEPLLTVEALDPAVAMPDETGDSFAENARLKSTAIASVLGGEIAVLADDSGLEVEALGGRPGVYSARFAGEEASDHENVAKLLAELEGVRDRGARFVCCLCLSLPSDERTYVGGRLVEVRGELKGQILAVASGDRGFGYDPIFRPEGWTHTLAEADPAEKDSVSHRGAASRELLNQLRTIRLGGAGED